MMHIGDKFLSVKNQRVTNKINCDNPYGLPPVCHDFAVLDMMRP